MSTVINNGYRLAAGTDPFTFIEDLRERLDPVRDRLDAADLMGRAVRLVDLADRHGVHRPRLPLLAAQKEADAEQDRLASKPLEHGNDPFRFEVAFARVASGDLLALLYAETTVLVEAWQEMPEVEAYDYDNRADRPADVPAAEWKRRRRDWAEVMPDGEAPVRRALVWKLRASHRFDLHRLRLVWNRDKPDVRDLLLDAAPTLRERAEQTVRDLIGAEITTRLAARANGAKPSTDAFLRAFLPHLHRTPPALQAIVDQAEDRLDPDAARYAADGLPVDGENHSNPVGLTDIEGQVATYLDAYEESR